MIDDLLQNVDDWTDEKQVYDYLIKTVQKKTYDKSGLIYGMGHAVYTLSDPRAVLLKQQAKRLCEEKGKMDIFNLYDTIEKLSPTAFAEVKGKEKVKAAIANFFRKLFFSKAEENA